MKSQKAITIISLVITIIILIILAGISISILTKNGIIEKAKFAKEKYQNSQIEENVIIESHEEKINNILNIGENKKVGLDINSLENYNEIYKSNISPDNGYKVTHTLNEKYPLIMIVVSGIGDGSGSYKASTKIDVNNTNQELIKLVDNECHPYASSKYYSTATVAYMINPDVGTTIECTAIYRGAAHIYALGNLENAIN